MTSEPHLSLSFSARERSRSITPATLAPETVALKVSAPGLKHKTAIGALALDVRDEAGVREAFRRLGAVSSRIATEINPNGSGPSPDAQFEPKILVEAMANPGDELFVAVRSDAIVPVLTIGRGGTHVERLDDVAIVPLPADRARIERVAGSAADTVEAIVRAAEGLALLECNPVVGAVVVDAIAQEVTP